MAPASVPGFPAQTPQFWNFLTIWDTFLTVNPLYTLIMPDRRRDIIRAVLAIFDRHGWLPDAWIANDYGSVQGGTHVDTMIADALVEGLGSFDESKANAGIRKNGALAGPALEPEAGGRQAGAISSKGTLPTIFRSATCR